MAISVRSTSVHDLTMTCREAGSGDPIVLLHGNPTSSYLWRHVMPGLEGLGRCLAPDLIGMGDSQKIAAAGPRSYRFADHRRYLDALLEQLGVTRRVILVGHDWGAVLGVDWARRHPQAIRGIAYLETLVAPVRSNSANAPDPALFGPLRGPEGESLVLQDNIFLEQVLPAGTQRTLSEAEMDAYRRPFREAGEGRRPMLTWTREIPLDGEPPDVHDVVSRNAAWMATTPVPKLFINAEPGALLTGDLREQCRSWPQQREVTVAGLHFLPEDSPQDITAALRDWIPTLP